MSTIPRLLNRHEHQVVMTLRSKPNVRAYQFKAANTLDAAFAGATDMFLVLRDRAYRSLSIRKLGIGITGESYRGLTKVHYDPQDFQGGVVPGDGAISFLRIAEQRPDLTFLPDGPIYVVPTPNFLSTARPHLSVAGTAPSVVALPTLLPPSGSMHFVLPRHSDNCAITNTGGSDIYVSFGAGQPELVVPTGMRVPFFDAAISEIFIRGDGGASTFTAYFALVNGTYA